MAMQVASLFASIGADTSGLQKGLKDAENAIKQSGQNMQKSGGLFDASVMITGLNQALEIASKVGEALQQVIEYSKEGAQVQRVESGFANLAASMGQDAQSIINSIKQASLGMVSEYDIALSSSKALMLGVGKSGDDLAKLMEVAAVRGRAMGISTTQAFNDIVTGIGRLSPMILDNLGIVTNAEATYSAYAESIGKTSKQLTDFEKKQALLNRVIGETEGLLAASGELVLDSLGKWEAMEASQKDYFDNLKKNLSDSTSWWADHWNEFYKSENMQQTYKDLIAEAEKYGIVVKDLPSPFINQGMGGTTFDMAIGQKNIDYLTEIIAKNKAMVEGMNNYERVWYGVWNTASSSLNGISESYTQLSHSSGVAIKGLALDIGFLEKELADAEINLGIAIQTFHESVGDSIYQGLRDAGLEGEELEKRLKFFDDLAGTDLTLRYKLEVETDQLLKDLLDPNFEANFSGKFAAFDDLFQPLIAEIATAKAEVDTLQSQIDALAGVYKIHFRISTSGTLPDLGGDGVGYLPSVEGEFAVGGYGLSGQPYIVGEAGPELFIPDVNGRVYSNASSSAMLGGDNGDLLAALGKLPSASDIAMAVRDALLMAGA